MKVQGSWCFGWTFSTADWGSSVHLVSIFTSWPIAWANHLSESYRRSEPRTQSWLTCHEKLVSNRTWSAILNVLELKKSSYLWYGLPSHGWSTNLGPVPSIHGARIAIAPRPSPSAAIVSSSEQWVPRKTAASQWWFATPSCLQVWGGESEHGIWKVMDMGGLFWFFWRSYMLVDGIICGFLFDCLVGTK